MSETFWSSHESQPKRQYRWIMNIGGTPQWLIKKVNRPGFTVSEATHKYLNHTFYYPGRVEYEKVSCTLVDPLNPDATGLILDYLSKSGYGIPDNANDTITLNKKAAVEAIGSVTISQLNGPGTVIDEFSLVNPFISSAKFGDLDYEGDNLIDLTLEFRYDFIEYKTKGAFTSVGGTTSPETGAAVTSPVSSLPG